MPVTFQDDVAVFTEICAIEEADALLAWLQQYPDGKVDLGGGQHIHTALVQLLMAFSPTIIVPPTDPFLSQVFQSLAKSGGKKV